MLLHLNFKSGKPVYLQLVNQVCAAVASGALRPGDPLPPIRPLAEELRVNRNTVARASAERDAQGVIETAAGKGCFVRHAGGTPLKKEARRKALAEALDEAVVRAHHLQLARAEFLRLAESCYDALAEKRAHAVGEART